MGTGQEGVWSILAGFLVMLGFFWAASTASQPAVRKWTNLYGQLVVATVGGRWMGRGSREAMLQLMGVVLCALYSASAFFLHKARKSAREETREIS